MFKDFFWNESKNKWTSNIRVQKQIKNIVERPSTNNLIKILNDKYE
jgi:hypothetical protein